MLNELVALAYLRAMNKVSSEDIDKYKKKILEEVSNNCTK